MDMLGLSLGDPEVRCPLCTAVVVQVLGYDG